MAASKFRAGPSEVAGWNRQEFRGPGGWKRGSGQMTRESREGGRWDPKGPDGTRMIISGKLTGSLRRAASLTFAQSPQRSRQFRIGLGNRLEGGEPAAVREGPKGTQCPDRPR